MAQVYFNLNDNLVRVTGFRNALTKVYLNAATTKTARLLDPADDSEITGSSVTLDYLAGSNGNYAKSIPTAGVDLSSLTSVIVEAKLIEGTVTATWRRTMDVGPRET